MVELISSSPQPKNQRRHLTPHNKAGGEHHQVGLVADGREIGNGAGHRSQPAGTGACKATWGRFRHRPQASAPLTGTCGYGFHRKQPQPDHSLGLSQWEESNELNLMVGARQHPQQRPLLRVLTAVVVRSPRLGVA